MSEDRNLEKMAFPFIRVAPRPSKPRESGLTIVADRGMGMHRLEDIVETAGEYVDYFKVAIGAFRLQPEAFLKRKIAALHKAGVKIFFAGDVSEAAVMQGVAKDYYKTVKRLGAEAVEISNAQIAISLADKCELIKVATAQGLKVVAEAGQKGHEDWTGSQAYIFEQVRAYKKAGAWKVLVQGEGISEGVASMKEQLLLNLVAHFDVQDFIFQAKDGGTQVWYLNAFGNAVNLDVDDHQVIDLELMRRGIRKRGVFGLVASL